MDTSRLIASDLSQRVLELRRFRGELGPQALDSQNRRLYPLPCVFVQREAFVVLAPEKTDSFNVEGQQRRRW